MVDLRKDDRGHWKRELEIPSELWKQLLHETLQGIIALLDVVAEGLEDANPPRNRVIILAGIYTFALEECGKLLRLSHLSPNQGKVTIDYGAFRSHTVKFNDAIAALPPECTNLRGGAFQRNAFQANAFQTGLLADFEARQAIFYSDITETSDGIVQIPVVNLELLRTAARSLREYAMNFQIPKRA